MQDLTRQDDLRNVFSPVVESTEKSTEARMKELAPMREEMINFNERLAAAEASESQLKQKRGKRKLDVRSADLNMVDQYPTTYDES